MLLIVVTLLMVLAGCGTCCFLQDLDEIDYAPLERDDWVVSTPEDQDLDPTLVARIYCAAENLQSIYSLLIIKNGYLIAEKYFNDGGIDEKNLLQSVSKSYTSALVGIAIEQGHISGVDQKMIDFFPDLAEQITDPMKSQITVQHLLQMRAGYPWEESTAELSEILWTGFRLSHIADVSLVYDPGAAMWYSNLSAHILAIIVARGSGMDLKSYAQMNLFSPLSVDLGEPWWTDWDGYYIGHGGIRFTSRDVAKFGLLYLNGGIHEGNQVVSADWVEESFQTYSTDAWEFAVGRNFQDIGYGYQWWSVRAGSHSYNLAWGHGGQQIAVLDELDMVIVLTGNPFQGESDDNTWRHEKANLNLVADFISTIPDGN